MSGNTLGAGQVRSVSFAELMASRYFIIPDYQRHYAWREKECRELFEDCVLTARNPSRQRFMSTITVIAPSSEAGLPTLTDMSFTSLEPLLVVDGQQRLTSLLIFIAAICQQVMTHGGSGEREAARDAYRRFVKTPLQSGGTTLRLLPQALPAHPDLMLQTLLKAVSVDNEEAAPGEWVIPAQARLIGARRVFDAGLRELRHLAPAALLACVANRLIFTLSSFQDVGQAGDVFEGLNNRGLGLSALENLKAYAIYAVQSFREGETLPPGTQAAGASALNESFNDAVGMIYHHLDRVGLPDDTARDLICASWPLFVTGVETARLSQRGSVPEFLDRAQPVHRIRESLHIPRAETDRDRSVFLNMLAEMVLSPGLVDASRYFADARRPMKPKSFLELPEDLLTQAEIKELRELHQRLVELELTTPFLPIMIAFRQRRAEDAKGYLQLMRLIERAACRVYVLRGEGNKGRGTQRLARLARTFADERSYEHLMLSLRSFALSEGTKDDPALEHEDTLSERAEQASHESDTRRAAVVAYEWLLTKRVELPGLRRFLKAHADGEALALVPQQRRAWLLSRGYHLESHDMRQPANIIVTQKSLPLTPTERSSIAGLSYTARRTRLLELGYRVTLPRSSFDLGQAKRMKDDVSAFIRRRWTIPEDGIIAEPTWSEAAASRLAAAAESELESEEPGEIDFDPFVDGEAA